MGDWLTGKDIDFPSLRWVTLARGVAVCLLCCFPEIGPFALLIHIGKKLFLQWRLDYLLR